MNFQAKKKMILFVVIICSELFTGLLFAGFGSAVVDEAKEDTTIYTIDKTDLLTIRFYPHFKRNSLEISVPGEKLTMKPHGTMSVGAG